MNTLGDVITYVRRIIKSASNDEITDSLIIDYINRFVINDVDARIQLFDLKTRYQFQTQPGYDQYNMPLYTVQTEPGPQNISYYPVYQGFEGPVYINGVEIPFYTQRQEFFRMWPNITQQMTASIQGDGSQGPYRFQFPIAPNNVMPNPLNTPFNYLLRGHVDMSGVIALANFIGGTDYLDPPLISPGQINAIVGNETNGNNFISKIPVMNVYPSVYITANGSDGRSIVVSDSGVFLDSAQNLGLLIQNGKAPNGNLPLVDGPAPYYSPTQNVINYLTGQIENLYFPEAIPNGVKINAQCYFFASGLPRAVLYNNNVLTFRSPPSQQWLVELDAYLTPAAYLSTESSIQFAYMSEYIARGAARKILSDTGDVEQFNFYEPLFREQETLVWKRSQRQFTSTRTPTIFSKGPGWTNSNGPGGYGY